ncbi:MAG: 6-phosphogluconolactonase [Deltaproteobacteria bacterium]|nr:6-phosphogluconolactonase [Deltaproteobacteria bacterium]
MCASERLVDWLRALAAERPSAAALRLAISGGSALEVVLRAAPRAGALWRRVALTWVDERCVPLADPDSNRGEAMRRGLLAPGRIVPLLEDGESPSAAIARYDRCHAEELGGGLDLVVLGLGPDGHVASLFPGRAWPASGVAAFVADSPKPPARRLTLTRGALAGARHVLLFATGESKREALERVLRGDPTLPATGLPGLVVVTDLEVSADAPPASRRVAPDPVDAR